LGESISHILVEPFGRFFYVSNRGRHSIAIFAVDQTTCRLKAVGHQPSQGHTLRGTSASIHRARFSVRRIMAATRSCTSALTGS